MGARQRLVTTVTCFAVFASQLLAAPACLAQELLRADESQREVWEQRVIAALDAEQTSRVELAQAEAIYSRGRSRHSLRGEERAKVLARIDVLRKEHEQAVRTLETLPEEARRAGALPGWIRDARERFESGDTGPRGPTAASATTTAPPASANDAADGADSTR